MLRSELASEINVFRLVGERAPGSRRLVSPVLVTHNIHNLTSRLFQVRLLLTNVHKGSPDMISRWLRFCLASGTFRLGKPAKVDAGEFPIFTSARVRIFFFPSSKTPVRHEMLLATTLAIIACVPAALGKTVARAAAPDKFVAPSLSPVGTLGTCQSDKGLPSHYQQRLGNSTNCWCTPQGLPWSANLSVSQTSAPRTARSRTRPLFRERVSVLPASERKQKLIL